MTNSKTTKRALLSSALALLMCVAMLVGTTFAWFTDTASTAINKIQAGTLDVALEMYENGEWVNAEGESLNFKTAGTTTNILWEPGCTYELPKLRVVNKGNLALKFAMKITGINGDAKLNEVIDWKVTYPSLPFGAGLVENLADMSLMNTNGNDGLCTLAVDKSVEFIISGHMQETATNEYQGLSIDGIAITVVATQTPAEYDSFDRDYDADAQLPSIWNGQTVADLTQDAEGVYHIENAAQFVKYIQAVGGNGAPAGVRYDTATVVLDRDIDLNGFTITRTGEAYQFSGNFDGQNHTVSNYTIKRTDNANYTGLFGYLYNASVKNLTVENATVIGQAQVAAIVPSVSNGVVENCHAVNCDIFGEKKVGAVVAYMAGGEVKNCSATDCNVFATDTRANQAGDVLGYFNGGVKSDLTATNVTVKTGAIIIANAGEFVDMMVNTQSGSSSFYTGKDIALACDIDLGGATVTGFGSEGAIFGGNFNGLGHTVSNFVINRADKEDFAGLFNYYCYGTLENLTVKNATVNGVCKVGALVGGVYDNATIKNCVVENCTVNANRKVGGAIGYAQQCTVSDCKVINTVINADIPAQAGEVIGYKNTGLVENGNTATGISIN